MDNTSMVQAFEGYKELVSHAENESHEIADALGFLAQAVEDMNHNDRELSVGALVGFLRALGSRPAPWASTWTKRERPEARSPRQRKAPYMKSRWPPPRCGATECAPSINIPSLPGK